MATRFPSPPPNYNRDATRDDEQNQNFTNASSSTVNLDAAQRAPVPHRNALTPYMTLPHYLSLTWLAYPVISLLFVAYRLFDSTSNANANIADAKTDLMSSCLAAQRAASSAASMPRYLAIGSNDAIQASVDAAMDAARFLMVTSLTIVESIIEFVVGMYKSTLLCFVELVVRGALGLIIGAVDEINEFINKTLAAIRTNIQNDVASANSVIQTAVSGINKVTSLVHVNLDVPQFSIPSLNALANVTLPTDFLDALNNLNASLPTVGQLKDGLDELIDKPFDAVIADINSTFASVQFNATTFALPAERTLTFCDNMDTSFVDDLGHDLVKIARIGAGIIAAIAILIVLANMALEWWRWRALQSHLEYIREAWSSDPTVQQSPKTSTAPAPSMSMTNHNLLVFLNTSEHPLISRMLDRFSTMFKLTPSQHVNARFFISYTTHPPALICLLIGLIGLLSVQIQLAAIHPLEAHYTAQASASVSSFSDSITTQLNAGMVNDSASYAAQVNAHIAQMQSTLDAGVFGWINTTTTKLNDTVVEFYADVQNIINATFGGTVLDSPAQEFVKCMLGSKVNSIEVALTWINENFQVKLPNMSSNALLLSNSSVSEISSPIAAAALGTSSPSNSTSNASSSDPNQSQGLVQKLIARYIAALKRERIMYAIFLGIWAFVALCALGIIAWHAYGVSDRIHEWKRQRYNKKMGFSDDHNRSGTQTPEMRTAASPWSSPRGLVVVNDGNGPFPSSKGNDLTSGAPGGGTLRASDAILAQDAALAQAYLSTTTNSGVRRSQSQYGNERRLPGGLSVEDEYDDGEKTPLPENLRNFTPLQTPRPAETTFNDSTTAGGSSGRFLAPSPFGSSTDLEKGSTPTSSMSKSRGLGGVSWGAVSGKLRNDSRRATARSPWDFDTAMQPKSTFEHSPAPETSANGWFSRALGAVWASGLGKKSTDAEKRSTMIDPYAMPVGSQRRVIRLDSDGGHNEITPAAAATANVPATGEELTTRQLAHQSVFDAPPRRPSNTSADGSFTLGLPPPPRQRFVAPPPSEMAERPRYLSTTYYANQSNSALPIHHQFVSPELDSPPPAPQTPHSAIPEPVSATPSNNGMLSPDPFGDQNPFEPAGTSRPRPDRSTFPPPGLMNANTTGRSLVPTSPGTETMRRKSHNRARSSLHGQGQDPFAGSPSPFEDPAQTAFGGRQQHPYAAPITPSNGSFVSGRSGAPRAF